MGNDKKLEIEKKSRLYEYWQMNIRANYKKISAIFGSMLTMVLSLVIYGIRTELDILSILMTIVCSMQPFIVILINIMFKGETELKDREIIFLKRELEFERDLTEYKLMTIALKATADWDKYNDLLSDIDGFKKKEPG